MRLHKDWIYSYCFSRIGRCLVGAVAFSARLQTRLISSKNSEKVVFDQIVTNIGSAYDASSGIFTTPTDGVYVFAWTVLTNPGYLFDTELVVDGNIKLYNAADSGGGKSYESSGCTGVLQLKSGEKVWIRKHGQYGNLLRSQWSSFSGWQIQWYVLLVWSIKSSTSSNTCLWPSFTPKIFFYIILVWKSLRQWLTVRLMVMPHTRSSLASASPKRVTFGGNKSYLRNNLHIQPRS